MRSPPNHPQLVHFLVEHPGCEFRARLLHCETYWHTQTQFYRHIFYDFSWIPNQPYQPKPPIGSIFVHLWPQQVYCEAFEISPTLAKTRELRKFDTRTSGSETQGSTGPPSIEKRWWICGFHGFESPLKSLNLFSEWEGRPRFMSYNVNFLTFFPVVWIQFENYFVESYLAPPWRYYCMSMGCTHQSLVHDLLMIFFHQYSTMCL